MNISRLPSLRQLRYFVVVAEELHFGRAARRLAISQPPLSQQIIALEAQLGVSLFQRTRRSVTLTPVGRQWLPAVKAVLAAAEALPEQAQRLARGETGVLSLGFVSTADYGVLPDLLRRFREACPDVEVRLREVTSNVQLEALAREELDAGLVIPEPEAPLLAPLQLHTLQRESLVAAVPEAWVREGRVAVARDKIALAQHLDAPLVLFPREAAPGLYDAIIGFYARLGARPVPGQQAIQMQTIVSLVSAGLGLALVPETLRHLRRSGVRYCALEETTPVMQTALAWRRDRISPALARFIELAGGPAGN